jgi:hypothetical protein
MNIKEIVQGWRNHLVPPAELKDAITSISEQRLSHCKTCEYNADKQDIKLSSRCGHCGCYLVPKSKCLDCSCPIGKWIAELTTSESNDMEIELNGPESSNQ